MAFDLCMNLRSAAMVAAMVIGPMQGDAQEPLPLHWDFNDSDAALPFVMTRDVETSVAKGVLRVEVTGDDPQLRLNVPARGPITVKARLRSGEGTFGLMEIFWRHQDAETFTPSQAAFFPLVHDMEWRDVEFPIPVVDGPIVLRLDTGWKKGVFEIDSLTIEDKPLSAEIAARIAALPEELAIGDGTLGVVMRPRDGRLTVTDHRTGREWWMDASGSQGRLVGAEQAGETALKLTLHDPAFDFDYVSMVRIEEDGILSIDLDTENKDSLFWALRNWPPSLRSSLPQGRIVFADRSSGTLITQRDAYYGGKDLVIYGNTQGTDMPFVGVFDWEAGDGIIVLAETPTDGEFALEREKDGVIWPRLRWMPSMDTFRYTRKMSYRFSAENNYVGLAGLYRDHAQKVGLRKTLLEKTAERPHTERLMGGAIIWGSTDANDFVREARQMGILRAAIGNASHGLRDVNGLRKLNEMGYLTFDYDSFSDIKDGPTGMQTDDVDETAYHSRPGLGPKGGWVNPDGTRYSDRSSAFALRAVKAYVPELIEKYGFNARFIDVSMAINLQEDWHPKHTFDRRQDMVYKRETFAWFRTLNLVMGTEHGNDWGMDLVDFTEGALGSPLHWKRQGTWWSGGFTQPTSEDDYRADWLKYGAGYDTSIPLWQLVYHDCVVSSWYWGDTPGIHYRAAPWITDRKDLMTLLYGGMTLLWRDNVDYGWPEMKDRFAQTYHDSAHFQGAVAYSPMVNHEFLSSDMALQRTTWENGTTVVVNFSNEPLPHQVSSGQDVVLAPLGYWAEGPEILQTRTIEDGNIIKRIETETFRQAETVKRVKVGPVEVEGNFMAFRMPEGHWQMVVEPRRVTEIDIAALTGWERDAPVSLVELDRFGEAVAAVPAAMKDGVLKLQPGEGSRFFALHGNTPRTTPLFYPAAGELILGQPVVATYPVEGAVVRATMDGSEPTMRSPRLPYGGLVPKDSVTIKARAFVDGRAVGEVAEAHYDGVRRLHGSEVMRSGDAPRFVTVPLKGGTRLRLRVGYADDHPWADWVDLGEPRLVRADGTMVKLGELEPAKKFQVYEDVTVNIRDDDGPLVVGGRTFADGLGLRSEAEVIWEIGEDFDRLEMWMGINDRAAQNAQLIQGTATVTLDLLP